MRLIRAIPLMSAVVMNPEPNQLYTVSSLNIFGLWSARIC